MEKEEEEESEMQPPQPPWEGQRRKGEGKGGEGAADNGMGGEGDEGEEKRSNDEVTDVLYLRWGEGMERPTKMQAPECNTAVQCTTVIPLNG